MLESLEAEHARIVEVGAVDSAGHAARVQRLVPLLEAYERVPASERAERLDSLAGALYDRLGFSYHALGDTTGWATASQRRLDLLFFAPDDSTKADEVVRMAYGVGQRDYAEGMRVLWTVAEGATASGDDALFAHAMLCIQALKALNPGVPVNVAQMERADGRACLPTDALIGALLALALCGGLIGWYGRTLRHVALSAV